MNTSEFLLELLGQPGQPCSYQQALNVETDSLTIIRCLQFLALLPQRFLKFFLTSANSIGKIVSYSMLFDLNSKWVGLLNYMP